MKAIVLTYDRNETITEHMISCYNDLWPDHPFIFRIPFNKDDRTQLTGRREYIKTSAEIKRTVLTLLQDLDDDEWIYWCIDDKYPVKLEVDRIKRLYNSILSRHAASISGILFCRARKMLDPAYLTGENAMIDGELLLERKAYKQIWIHQFLRVKVIRYMFESFPDSIQKAKLMDDMKDNLIKPSGHHLYVTASNCAVFGESTINGVMTENCIKSLSDKGFQIPGWQAPRPQPPALIGEL